MSDLFLVLYVIALIVLFAALMAIRQHFLAIKHIESLKNEEKSKLTDHGSK